jgi:hypothetical protein
MHKQQQRQQPSVVPGNCALLRSSHTTAYTGSLQRVAERVCMEGQFMAAACRMLSTHAAAQGTADQARVLVTFTTALAKQHWAPQVCMHIHRSCCCMLNSSSAADALPVLQKYVWVGAWTGIECRPAHSDATYTMVALLACKPDHDTAAHSSTHTRDTSRPYLLQLREPSKSTYTRNDSWVIHPARRWSQSTNGQPQCC